MAGVNLRTARRALWAVVAIAAIGAAWFAWQTPGIPDQQQVFSTLGQGDYSLVTAEGAAFTQADLKGQPTAVFFGFTHCPDVCPTTLGEITAWQEDLSAEGEELRVFFITVDPERDTREVLGDYVSWVRGVTGITGEPAEIDEAIADFRVFAQKVPLDGGGYTVNHSSQVLLFDSDGSFFAPIGYQEDHDRAMRTIRELLAS